MTDLEKFADYLDRNGSFFDEPLTDYRFSLHIREFYKKLRAPKVTGNGSYCYSDKHYIGAGYCPDCCP
jgi:hypothetical protein